MTPSTTAGATSAPRPLKIWTDEDEQSQWYRKMDALEAAAQKAEIAATAITADMAIRWRASGRLAPDARAQERGRAASERRRTDENPPAVNSNPQKPIPGERRL